MNMKVCILLVAYGNMQEVDTFVDHARAMLGQGISFAICDNSPQAVISRHCGDPQVTITMRPDNPGYLEGALVALEARTLATEERPDWIVLSNTDLRFETTNLRQRLAAYNASAPLVIAPRVTEGQRRIEKNPHLATRRTLRRLRLNSLIAATPLSAMAYQTGALLRGSLRQGVSRLREVPDEWARIHPAGTRFYSPYGAIIIFSRGFFEAGGLPRNVPLLAEEYFIAEAALEYDAPVIYEPDIHVHHSANTTTGPRVTLRRARRTSAAFRAISEDAYRRRGMQP